MHGDWTDDVLAERYLTEHAVDELGAATTTINDEYFGAGTEQPASTCRRGRLFRKRFASRTQMPARVMTMWSTFAREREPQTSAEALQARCQAEADRAAEQLRRAVRTPTAQDPNRTAAREAAER